MKTWLTDLGEEFRCALNRFIYIFLSDRPISYQKFSRWRLSLKTCSSFIQSRLDESCVNESASALDVSSLFFKIFMLTRVGFGIIREFCIPSWLIRPVYLNFGGEILTWTMFWFDVSRSYSNGFGHLFSVSVDILARETIAVSNPSWLLVFWNSRSCHSARWLSKLLDRVRKVKWSNLAVYLMALKSIHTHTERERNGKNKSVRRFHAVMHALAFLYRGSVL